MLDLLQTWMAGSLRLLLVWAQYSYRLRRLLPWEVFVEGRCVGAIIGYGDNLHWNRCTLPVPVLPQGWRLCFRFWGEPGDAWLHRHFVVPDEKGARDG